MFRNRILRRATTPLAIAVIGVALMAAGNTHFTIRNQGAIVRDLTWRTNQIPIPVCWEDPLPVDAAQAAKVQGDRQSVRDAVEATWVAASAVQFSGWGACTNAPAVRIFIADDIDNGPHTKTLGRRLLNFPHGVSLDFAFRSWGASCSADEATRVACLKAVAVHEFGHILGFAHEQNRADSPCKNQDQGPDPDQYVTDYDADSIMNYCNRKWNNGGALSDLDKKGIATLYGAHA